jgi:hypothetical protein
MPASGLLNSKKAPIRDQFRGRRKALYRHVMANRGAGGKLQAAAAVTNAPAADA